MSVTPAELNFHLEIGKEVDFENIYYISFSSVFNKFLQRDLQDSESIHYVEDFIQEHELPTEFRDNETLLTDLLDNVQQKQSFIYSDYRYEDESVKDRIIRIAKTNEFWRQILSNNPIDYVFSCSGGEYVRRCGFYVAQEFSTEFYFTYSVFPSKENSRVVFEPTEMQQIIEGKRSDSPTQSESQGIIESFHTNDGVEFSRSVTDIPVDFDDAISFFNVLKREAVIQLSGTQTDFGWNIDEKIRDKFRGSLRYFHNNKLYLTQPPDDPFILLALHSNQDAQITCREPRFYNNQLGLVRAISNLLPYPYTLCVKQHPVELGQYPPSKLQELRSEQTNIEFIDPKTSPSVLFDDALAIVTIRSTIGLEALLHGCSVVTFGNPYYTNTGATISASFDDIEAPLLEAIQNDGPDPTEVEDLVSYLWESSYPGDTIGRLKQWNIPYLAAGVESLVK